MFDAGEVYNYYSTGDEVFHEVANPPWLFAGWDESMANCCWQKQETLKGSAVLAGTAYGGWGFHNWTVRELVQDIGGISHYEDRTYRYSPEDAARMIADGSITNNPVFNRDFSPMFDHDASQDDQWLAVAKYVPAVSSAVGGMEMGRVVNNVDMNKNSVDGGVPRPNQWGRDSPGWQHSDMKDMAYFYVYKLYEQLIQKGGLK